MPEITNMAAPEIKQEIPPVMPEVSHDDTPIVLDAEAEAAIDATLARIETSIKDHVMTAQKPVPMQHVTAILAGIEMRADRIIASIFGAK
ncbi:MAG: hypothetical protein L0Y60_03660 [Beijerinckiaceae bacterium]|nr:hypothetical protein [Beijerinckiaceae bacterium]